MYHLANKVALVTGGANGIGAGIVEEFLKENVKFIAILDIDETSGQELEKRIISNHGHQMAKFFKCDVTNDDELHDIFDKITEEFGSIDVVVNNAGIFHETLVTYKKEIAVNFSATVSSTYKAIDLMRVDRAGKGGTIINISSIAALSLLSPSLFTYSATKLAVLHFSSCVGKEEYFRHTKVRVLTVCFGITESSIWDKMEVFDKLAQETIDNIKEKKMQSGEIAAQGLIQSYMSGKSGSTWLINHDKVTDISDDIQQAFKVMSTNAKI